MEPSLLRQSHVEMSRIAPLTLGYDATDTLHGKATRAPAQRCERPAGLWTCFKHRRIVISGTVCLLVLLFHLD